MDESSRCDAAVVSVSWVVSWAGWLIQTGVGQVEDLRCVGGAEAVRVSGACVGQYGAPVGGLSVANPKCTSAGVCSPMPV